MIGSYEELEAWTHRFLTRRTRKRRVTRKRLAQYLSMQKQLKARRLGHHERWSRRAFEREMVQAVIRKKP